MLRKMELYLLCPTRLYDVQMDDFTFTEECNSLNGGLLWRRAWWILQTERQADNTQKLKDLTIVTWQQRIPLPIVFVTTSSALRYTLSKFHFYVGSAACWNTESAVSVASRQHRRRNQYRRAVLRKCLNALLLWRSENLGQRPAWHSALSCLRYTYFRICLHSLFTMRPTHVTAQVSAVR
jgi:hypothetical protein